MAKAEPLQHVPVFVGSTFQDLQPYRDAVRGALYDPALRKAAIDKMKDELEQLAGDCPDLTNKIADLQSQLDGWSRQSLEDDVPM